MHLFCNTKKASLRIQDELYHSYIQGEYRIQGKYR
jgi:hypothetical protein